MSVGTWEEGKPKFHGKYLVCRQDGNIHFETWNGTGWSYNNKVIIFWAEIKSPLK